MNANDPSLNETATVERCVYFNVSAYQLWQAITSRTIIDKYFILPTTCLELVHGGEISFGLGNNKVIYGTIDLIEAPNQLHYSFSFAHYPDDPASHVCYTVEKIGPALSCLYLRHENILLASETLRDVKFGWDRILSEMKSYLETGRRLNWPEDPAPRVPAQSTRATTKL